MIDQITAQFYDVFTNINRQPNWNVINEICLPETVIIKKSKQNIEIYNLENFIAPRREILSNGTLLTFQELETKEETTISGNIAQRFSSYEKSGKLNGLLFKGNGHKMLQFIKTKLGWKIYSVVWEDEI